MATNWKFGIIVEIVDMKASKKIANLTMMGAIIAIH
jgi:hypothetical protein